MLLGPVFKKLLARKWPLRWRNIGSEAKLTAKHNLIKPEKLSSKMQRPFHTRQIACLKIKTYIPLCS